MTEQCVDLTARSTGEQAEPDTVLRLESLYRKQETQGKNPQKPHFNRFCHKLISLLEARKGRFGCKNTGIYL